ncbi:MAG: hypothetical protein IT383_07520 [Deltaproteobacteria bacterium]|nr:hypothetical protein [Deltaproteobacteria bacterium]
MRAIVAMCIMLAGGAAHAAPWHARAATELGVAPTDELVALALSPFEGEGFLVGWNGSQMHLHPVAHTLVSGPIVGGALAQVIPATRRPTIAFSGGDVAVSGNGSSIMHGVVGATSFGTSAGNFYAMGMMGVAGDPIVARRMLGSWDAFPGGNLSVVADGFAADSTSFDVREVGTGGYHLSAVLATRGGSGVVIDAELPAAIWASPDVTLVGSWWRATTTPAEVDGSAALAVNDDGLYLVAAQLGTVVVVADFSGTAEPSTCLQAGAPDFCAVAALGTDFVLADTAGDAHVLTVDGSCNQSWQPAQATGIGGPIHAISARGPREILVVGEDGAGAPRIAWRNRPPLVPTVPAIVNGTEGVPMSATALSSDPDLSAGASDSWSYAWTCDPELSVSGVDTPTIIVDAPSMCVDADTPGARKDYACTVVAHDEEGAASPAAFTTFAILPVDNDAPTGVALDGLSDGDIVPNGAVLSLTALATEECARESVWTVRDEATGTVREQQTLAWGSTFTFTAVTQGADQLTWYTLELSVTDTAGLAGALGPFRFGVGLPQPPLDVRLSCPDAIEAGSAGSALATPMPGGGLVLDYSWVIGGAGTLDDLTPSDDTLTFQTDACDGGAETRVRMQAHGLFEDASWQRCTIALLDPPNPAPPTLTLAEAPALDVSLGERPVAVLLHPIVTACASHPLDVRWDLSAVPDALRPSGVDGAGALVLGRAEPLTLTVDPVQLAALHGMVVPVRATAVDEHTALHSEIVEVRLRFGADALLSANAGVDVQLTLGALGPVAEGDLVAVYGTIATDLAVALPTLTVTLAGEGFAAAPGSVVTKSRCGAHAVVEHQGSDALLTLEGVSATCPLELRLLARRGFGANGIAARACAWGAERTPLARCEGGLVLDAPRALSCAAGGGSPLVAIVLLLARVWRRRR